MSYFTQLMALYICPFVETSFTAVKLHLNPSTRNTVEVEAVVFDIIIWTDLQYFALYALIVPKDSPSIN